MIPDLEDLDIKDGDIVMLRLEFPFLFPVLVTVLSVNFKDKEISTCR